MKIAKLIFNSESNEKNNKSAYLPTFFLKVYLILNLMSNTRDENKIKQFGAKLQAFRKAKKLSIRKLAAIADIDYSQVHRIEQGQVNPTLTTIYVLAEALGVMPCDFFDC